MPAKSRLIGQIWWQVFEKKFKALIDYIICSALFGKVIAHVGTVEFQKRGLPHVHLLFTLTKMTKLIDSARIDDVIRAELPDPDKEPMLYELVTRNNLHQCCKTDSNGRITMYFPCMSSEKPQCNKKFPKEYRDATVIESGDYAKYCRRRSDIVHTTTAAVFEKR